MDPNANLAEQIEISRRLLSDTVYDEDDTAMMALRLAELVQAQHTWLMLGGYLPAAWARARVSKCDECEREIPDAAELFNAYHAKSCSLHPSNIAP
jgi:plasmid maintenance system antidote protein VapI